MDRLTRLLNKIFHFHEVAKRHRRMLTALAAVVVFVTTYSLILPAATMDKEAAQKDGVHLETEASTAAATAAETEAKKETEAKTEAETKAETEPAAEENTTEAAKESKKETQKETQKETESASAEETTQAAAESETAAETTAEKTTAAETTAEVLTDATEFTFEGKDYTIKATVGKDSGLPADVQMEVTEIRQDDPEQTDVYNTYYQKALEKVQKDGEADGKTEALETARFFDISFLSDGQEYVPASKTEVQFTYKDNAFAVADKDKVSVYHLDYESKEDPEAIELTDIQTKEDEEKPEDVTDITEIDFDAEKFDVYCVAETVDNSAGKLTAEGEDYKVTLKYDEKAEVPVGSKLTVREIEQGTDEYQKLYDQALEAVTGKTTDEMADEAADSQAEQDAAAAADAAYNGETAVAEENGEAAPSLSFARFFDITISYKGEKIEPAEAVQVSIDYLNGTGAQIEDEENQELQVVHFKDNEEDGTTEPELIDADKTKTTDDGTISKVTYQQDSFSVTGTVVQAYGAANSGATGTSSLPSTEDGYYYIIIKYDGYYYAINKYGEVDNVEYDETNNKVTFTHFIEGEDSGSDNLLDWYLWKTVSTDSGTAILNKDGTTYLDPQAPDVASSLNDYVMHCVGTSPRDMTIGTNGTGQYYELMDSSGNVVTVTLQGSPAGGLYIQAGNVNTGYYPVFITNNAEVDYHEYSVLGLKDDEGNTIQPGVTDIGSPEVDKYMTDNGNGTYNLTLSVKGKAASTQISDKADVIVVCDLSNSMLNEINGETRFDIEKEQLKALADTFAAVNASTPDTVNMWLIGFGNKAYNFTPSNNTVANFKTQLDNQQFAPNSANVTDTSYLGNLSATNWEAALSMANSISGRSDAQKYVIFLSDGNPTVRNTAGSYTPSDTLATIFDYQSMQNVTYYGTGSDKNHTVVDRCFEYGLIEAKKTRTDSHAIFFSISALGNATRMKDLCYLVNNKSLANYYDATDKTKLAEALEDIGKYISKSCDFTGVSLKDTLTSLTKTFGGAIVNANPLDTDGDGTYDFVYKITDASGADVTDTELSNVSKAVYTPGTLDESTGAYSGGSVTWNLYTGDTIDENTYTLKDGYTYSVSWTVWPNQDAYDTYSDLHQGNASASDLDTDLWKLPSETDDGDYRIYSNTDDQTVTYYERTVENDQTTLGDPITNNIDKHPTMAMAEAEVTVTKQWLGGTGDDQFDLKVDVLKDGEYYTTLTLTSADSYTATLPIQLGLMVIENGYSLSASDIADHITLLNKGHTYTFTNERAVNAADQSKVDAWDFSSLIYRPILMAYSGDYDMTKPVPYVENPLNVGTSADNSPLQIFTPEEHDEVSSNPKQALSIDGKYYYAVDPDDDGCDRILMPTNTKNSTASFDIEKVLWDASGTEVTDSTETFSYTVTMDATARVYITDASGEKLSSSAMDSALTVADSANKTYVSSDTEYEITGDFNVTITPGQVVHVHEVPVNTNIVVTEDGKDGFELIKRELRTGSSGEYQEFTNTEYPSSIGGTLSSADNYGLRFTNQASSITTEITVKKVDSDTSATLAGAKFQLSKENSSGGWDAVGDEFTISDGNGYTITDLTSGSYKLTETEAPDGYVIMIKETYFDVADDGTISLDDSEEHSHVVLDSSSKTLTVKNKAGELLPDTGGMGTTPYRYGGLIIVLAAITAGYVRMRRRERRS